MTDLPPPGQEPGKKSKVEAMFDAIASRYDLLNRLLSLGFDQHWRRRAVDLLDDRSPRRILDVATGTADQALQALRLEPDEVVGVDLSEEMLERGRRKVRDRNEQDRVRLRRADAEDLPFESSAFDGAMVAFGVRNFENLQRGLREIERVLEPGGTLVVLEFSRPRATPLRQLYGFYLHVVLPRIGGLLSPVGGAYRYLPDSVAVFPDGEAFLAELEQAGFDRTEWVPLLFGVASLYRARVPEP